MNEGNSTSLAPDIQRFATSAVQHLSDLTAAVYDLREACRFFTEGYSGSSGGVPTGSVEAPGRDSPAPLAEQGGERDARQCEMELDEGSSGVQQSDEAPARNVKYATLEHLCVGSRYVDKVPSTVDAAAVLDSFKTPFVPIMEYYDAFKRYCVAHKLAELNRKGMRYLAYCCGYTRVRSGGINKLVPREK